MTVGTVIFYKMKGSLSSGEYPLLTTGQNLSSYQVHSATVKYAKGLQTRLTVPSFTNWETVNIALIGNDFYWVTASRESTTYNESIEFTLDYMPPTSWFRSGNTVKGAWNRLPTNTAKYLKDNVTNDVLAISTYTDDIGSTIKITPEGQDPYYYYFWQVCGYDNQNNLHRYGGLFSFDKDNLATSHVIGATPQGGGDFGYYADFEDLFANMNDCIGLLPENVIDFSISQRMPFKTKVESGNPIKFGFEKTDGTYATPTKNGSGHLYSYDLGTMAHTLKPSNKDTSLTITDMERITGQLNVFDWNGNAVLSIPTQYADSNTISVNFRTLCDISGIYTIVTCNDIQLSITEGRLPYNSNTWETYKAYQMDTDRTSMENTIRFSEYNRETQAQVGAFNAVSSGVQTGVMTGIMAGNPLGALAGIPFGAMDWAVSDWQSYRANELTRLQAQANFDLAQKQAINQPQTAYNSGYGFIYCLLNELRRMRLAVSIPKHLDSTYFTAWTDNYGYPAEGVFSATIGNGYFQGKLLSDAVSKSGMYWDELNKTFMQGFKFISP